MIMYKTRAKILHMYTCDKLDKSGPAGRRVLLAWWGVIEINNDH